MIGFIIFGWPKKEKWYGVASPGYCDHCANQSRWHLLKTRRWFTLFFLPVCPLSTASYFLTCEICGVGIELEKSEAKEAKELVRLTEDYENHEGSEEEYVEAINEFSEQVNSDDETGPELEPDADTKEIPQSQ